MDEEVAHRLDGHVAVSVDTRGGRVTYPMLRSAGALAVRMAADEAWLVGAGAHPVGGDRLRVDLHVGEGATLGVRSMSASLARPSIPPLPSFFHVEADVGKGAALTWRPEPGIAARGSEHVSSARIRLGATSRLCWSDVVVLGRANEAPGSWSSRIRIEVDGRPVLDNEARLGPAYPSWASPAALAGARCAVTLVLLDPGRRAPSALTHGAAGVILPVGAHGLSCMTWGHSPGECQQRADELFADRALVEWSTGAGYAGRAA